jgi:integrase
LKFVKTIVLDAKRNGYDVSYQIDSFKGYTRRSPIVILSLEELESINALEFDNERYEITRDWLVIGFYTGQRVSDLLKMVKTMIERIDSFDFIVLRQKKTQKVVHIPIHPEVRRVLDKRDGHFPPLFTQNLDSNKAMFNRYLKEICKQAGIDELVDGNATDPDGKDGRKRIGIYEKWKLVSSHICRRSFASHFYGQPGYSTPLLMNITAHSSEKQFLEYIGKPPIDYSIQLANIWKMENKHI